MKHWLLPEEGEFYKANMHCHSTLSDGCLTPQEIKEEYMKRGYSIVAFTDHENIFNHNDLSNQDFLAINGYEVSITNYEIPVNNLRQCYHLNCYALENKEKNIMLPKPEYKDLAGINNYIKKLNDDGFIVCYNHPYWSLQTLDDYRDLEGLFAMEIFNYTVFNGTGTDGNQTQVYDTMLRLGKRICCIASDDNHNKRPLDHPQSDSFGGFVMIKADNLDYDTIMNAIQNKNFYASAAPIIEELYIEDEIVKINCSPAVRITMNTAGRRCGIANAPEGEFLTAAEFSIDPTDKYIRLEVTDERGRRANSRAYFLEEFMK